MATSRTEQAFRPALLHPRYWGIWAGLGLLWLLVRLPHRTQMQLGRWLGLGLYRLTRNRRHITETNIRLCFPARSAAAQQALVRDSFISYGRSILESGNALLRDTRHLQARTRVTGVEHIKAAQAAGRGVLMVGAHFSTIDLVGALISPQLDMDVIYRNSPNALFDWFIRRSRGRHFGNVWRKDNTRGIIRVHQFQKLELFT
ncbi:MAG: lipid A biosynthesis acyltransferase, partial [Gammaproteobacteria bacterium]